MNLITDACTVILLAKASILRTTAETYTLIMPQEVKTEVLAGKIIHATDAFIIEKLIEEKAIRITKTKNTQIYEQLQKDFGMGNGEAAVLAYARNKKSSIVATDNRQGRKAAKINSLPLTGSIDILIALYKQGKLTSEKARQALKILETEGWFDIHLIEKAQEDILQ